MRNLRYCRGPVGERYGVLNVNLGHMLVVSQISLSLLILVSAGLLVRTLSNLESIGLGFNRENVLLFQLNARQAGHKDPEIAAFYQELQMRFRSIPGVRSATLATRSMAGSGTDLHRISVGGKQLVARGNLFLSVGPSFFSTMQIPILRGREIDERDQPGSTSVAVVNQLFARAALAMRTLWAGTSPSVGAAVDTRPLISRLWASARTRDTVT